MWVVMVAFKMESRGQILMEPRELAARLDMESKGKSEIKGDSYVFGLRTWVNGGDPSER